MAAVGLRQAGSRDGDVAALVAVYNAFNGPHWNVPWDLESDPETWHGVKTNDDGRVVELKLEDENMTGPIPTALLQLDILQSLTITGRIGSYAIADYDWGPSRLTGSYAIADYDWGPSRLTGSIPGELCQLENLHTLTIEDNGLTGSIPKELGGLEKLKSLTIIGGGLTGSIPTELGLMEKLESLTIRGDGLTGSIPTGLGGMENLKSLTIDGNKLTGSIPTELGFMEKLESLTIRGDGLTGSIPTGLGGMENLKSLTITGDDLTGSIPTELGLMEKLESLTIRGDGLTGPIPTELGGMEKLESLQIRGSGLTGSIPEQLGQLANLEVLSLYGYELTGSIPEQLGQLTNLFFLKLCGNKLTGSIPEQLGQLVNLSNLDLSGNKLTGSIPEQLGQLTNLSFLDLSGDKLTGSIPEQLGQLTNLFFLDLSGNKLTEMGSYEDAMKVLGLFERCRLLRLDGNPWEYPPAAVVAGGVDRIQGYYEELGKDTKPLKTESLKVVFAGHSGAGKTSLIKSIKAGRGQLTEGDELESVGVSVSDLVLDGHITARLYDLAGQPDYYGLHQLFMTSKAVYVLTWDISKFLRRTTALVKQLMEWITALHFRAPNATVILVGTHRDKCEGSGWGTRLFMGLSRAPPLEMVMEDVEVRLRSEYQAWKDRRVQDDASPVQDDGVTIEEGVVLVSSLPGVPDNVNGFSELRKRLTNHEGITSYIPPSWKLALVVLDALREGCDPVNAAQRSLNIVQTPQPVNNEGRPWVKKLEIYSKWAQLQASLPNLQKARDTVFAMENALNLREYGGTLLRHPEAVFLDVEYFALHLAPILNHKTDETDEDGRAKFGGKTLDQGWQLDARKHLVGRGILHRKFAEFLWDSTGGPFPDLVFDVLIKLGIIFPINSFDCSDGEVTEAQRPIVGQTTTTNAGQGGMRGGSFLVLMRLAYDAAPETSSRMKAFMKLKEPWGVTCKWRFHRGRAPHGLVERLIASCHLIADVVPGTCWRRGACFVAHTEGKRVAGGSYALSLDFSGTESENMPTSGTLNITVYGDREGRAVWGGMRFAISAVWRLIEEFPGLGWSAWLECPRDGNELHHLPCARDDQRARRRGAPIVPPSSALLCRCSVADGIAQRLGLVVSAGATLDEVFERSGGYDGGVTTRETEEDFAASLDDILSEVSSGTSAAKGDLPHTAYTKMDAEWVKDVAIAGPMGVLALVALWEPIVEVAERWANDDFGAGTLVLTVFLAVLFLIVAVPLGTICARQLRRQVHSWRLHTPTSIRKE